jgi:hypothetical protein
MRWLSITLAACGALSLSAQTDSAGYAPRLNVIKVGGSSGLFSILSLSYERVLNTELSVSLTGSYLMPVRPEGLLNLETDELVIGGDREFKGWFITPEVKWYLEHSDSRPAPRGFYMGAYLRASNMRYTSTVSGTSTGTSASGEFTSDLQIDLTELGFGIDAGYQLLIKDRVAIDFIFFGPRYSLYTLKVDADLQGDGELFDDLASALEKLLGREIVPVNIDLDKSGSSSSTSNGLGYRMGFKIGYAF